MKVYKIELVIIDHDAVGDDIPEIIENARFPNRCIRPHVTKVESKDIGEWNDDHPLNSTKTFDAEVKRLFP